MGPGETQRRPSVSKKCDSSLRPLKAVTGSTHGFEIAGILGIGIRLAIRPATVPARISLFAVLLAAMGLVELAVSSLADAGETERHLLLFHVITDFTIMLAIAWAAWVFQGKASLRTNS